MEVSTVLISTFIVLVGLQLCVPETPNGKEGEFEKGVIEQFWTKNPLLRIIYGLCNILGVVFVLGFMGYLVFTEKWWYIGVYVLGLILAKFVAFILRILLIPLYKKESSIYAQVLVQRIFGIIIILIGMILIMLI